MHTTITDTSNTQARNTTVYAYDTLYEGLVISFTSSSKEIKKWKSGQEMETGSAPISSEVSLSQYEVTLKIY